MNCVDFVCGTGGWKGPKPGDPDLGNVSLRATPAFGGVSVTWTLPNLHPYAVAYTIVYRGVSSNFESAIEIGRVAGNRYLDPMELHDSGLYYYWIKLISIHGTDGELVGPAECRMYSTIGEIIDGLSGEINEGVLHRSLLEKIDRIQMLGAGLTNESKAREQDIIAVTKLIESLELQVDDSRAAIESETLLRISSVDTIARKLQTLEAQFEDNYGIIQHELGVLASADQVLARDISVAQVTANDALSAFESERSARISADQALARAVDTVETEMAGNLAQARATLQTNINTVNGKVTAIGARYTVQVQANGLAGGFGVYNDGKTVDAGFIADRFWIGSTASNKRKPFIVKSGVVYIDQAVIENASISSAKIQDGAISSAKIGNAAITSAKIGNLEVDTINIRNGAVGTAGTSSAPFWLDVGPYGAQVAVFFLADPIPRSGWRGAHIPRGDVTCSFSGIRAVSQETVAVKTSDGNGNPTSEVCAYSTGMGSGWVGAGSHLVSFPTPGRAVVIVLKR